VILTGARLAPRKALDLGFVFEFPRIAEALRDLVALGVPG
jgi:NAD dependent epimerase/dehydratase family enzyme